MTVSEQIISVIDELCKKFGIAVDWTAEHILPYIQKLCEKFIQYEIVTSIAWMILPIIVMAIFTPVTAILHKRAMALPKRGSGWNTYDDNAAITYFKIISWVCLVISILWTIIAITRQSMDIIEAKTFPEKLIFEYVSSLIK